MILLDTDHISVLQMTDGPRTRRLQERLTSLTDTVIGTTIVTVEEQMRGWLSVIAKERQPKRQIAAYRNLAQLFEFFAQFHLAPWNEAAVKHFESMPSTCKRVGAMDRKIAAICLANSAMLLTANSQDFELIPGLSISNWLD